MLAGAVFRTAGGITSSFPSRRPSAPFRDGADGFASGSNSARAGAVAVGIVISAAGTAGAQITNVQPLIGRDDTQGFSGAVEGAADWRTGNTGLLLLSESGLARYRTGDHLVFLVERAEFGLQAGEDFVNKNFEHLRYRFEAWDLVGLETFAQHDSDEFRRLALRVLWGAGPRFRLFGSRNGDLFLGVAYMLEFERLSEGPEADSGDEKLSHRLSSYLAATFFQDAPVGGGLAVYAQPRLDWMTDVRVLVDAEIVVKASDSLAFKTAFSATWDSEPPDGLDRLDTALKSGVVFRF
jgi:hypothetical protein